MKRLLYFLFIWLFLASLVGISSCAYTAPIAGIGAKIIEKSGSDTDQGQVATQDQELSAQRYWDPGKKRYYRLDQNRKRVYE